MRVRLRVSRKELNHHSLAIIDLALSDLPTISDEKNGLRKHVTVGYVEENSPQTN